MIIYNSNGNIDNAFIVKAVNDKLQYNHRIKHLQDYYEGDHEILKRYYQDENKPNNKIVANYMQSVADFLTAYLVGRPIIYENIPAIISDILNYNDNDATTQDVTLNMNVVGYGVELFYMDEDGIPRFASIDPTESIVIMDNSLTGNLTQFIRLFPKDDKAEGYNVTLYDKGGYIEYSLTMAIGELTVIQEYTHHYFGDVPAIIYPNNKKLQGSFEQLIPLQDALNKVTSDNVNDWEGFVDAYLILENMRAATPEDIAQMQTSRVMLTDENSKAYWLTKTADVAHVEQLKGDLVAFIRELGKFPDITDIGGLGSSGIAIQMKLIPTEMQASKQERILQKGIQRKLELLYNIVKLTSPTVGEYTDVRPVFSRNFLLETGTDKDTINNISTMLSDGYIDRRKALELNKLIKPNEIDDILTRLDLEDYGVPRDDGEED